MKCQKSPSAALRQRLIMEDFPKDPVLPSQPCGTLGNVFWQLLDLLDNTYEKKRWPSTKRWPIQTREMVVELVEPIHGEKKKD